MAKDFYAPKEIWFSRQQVLWLIRDLPTLRGGYWPAEASNYIDISGKKTGRRKAPFITAAECYIEISARLEKCGIDGLILLAIECWGESEASLAKYLRMPEYSIRKRRKSALGYVASGPVRRWHTIKKRKGETYQEFKLRKGTHKAK